MLVPDVIPYFSLSGGRVLPRLQPLRRDLSPVKRSMYRLYTAYLAVHYFHNPKVWLALLGA
jgi:hypothetical protein